MILFTKMQGCGNDYVYINNDIERIKEMSEFTKSISNRNFGIGSDGCIFIFKDDNAITDYSAPRRKTDTADSDDME